MKKLISVALVMLMVIALATASFSALNSPEPAGKHSVVSGSEGQGTGSSDQTAVEDGGKVTLTAKEAGGYFTKWIMTGQYEAVDGDEYSPVFTIIPLSDVSAIASFSADPEYLTISGSATGDGTWTAEPAKVLKGSNETVTLTATEANDPFVKWELACEYDIVEGTLTSKTLVIRPYTDIKVTAVFGSDTPSPENPDGGNTSPKTGDNTVTVFAIVLMAMALGLFAVKKIKE